MSNHYPSESSVSDGAGAPKLPWVKPVLHTLGDLQALTRKVDKVGRRDGGKFPKRRT